jgi:hypothetical protein
VGNSTQTFRQKLDALAARGVFDPRKAPSGYGDALTFEIINNSMADFICERFNWPFNRSNATPFATNSWQQDYPQLAQPGGPIAWGEDCDQVDVNNSMNPQPLWNVTWRRGLSRIRTNLAPVQPGNWQICWMYNKDLSFGAWPGANTTYYPLITTGVVQQNPIMSMVDKNQNLLIVTGFGTTGSVAPFATANALEGTVVTDGSVTWTVVSPTSQGFRVFPLPNATGPTYLIVPSYQLEPPVISDLGATLDPIPDSYSRHFVRILDFQCQMASTDPAKKKEALDGYPLYLKSLEGAKKQGDKTPNAYGLVPASSPVESTWPGASFRGTADSPF